MSTPREPPYPITADEVQEAETAVEKALEIAETKAPEHEQTELLKTLLKEVRHVKKEISAGFRPGESAGESVSYVNERVESSGGLAGFLAGLDAIFAGDSRESTN